MIKLTIDNSICQIEGLDAKRSKEIKRLLSYQEKPNFAYAGGRRRPFTRYLIDKYGNHPTGLLYLTEEFLRKHKLEYTRDDKRTRPKTGLIGKSMFLSTFDKTPYIEQIEAAEAAVRETRGIITGPTGVGKTLMAACIVDAIQVKTLIVVPRTGLKKQTIAGLRECFGEDMVGPLVNGKAKYFITVENIDQLEGKNKSKLEVDMVLIDEFHRSGAKTYRTVNRTQWNHIFYKFGLTATPFRSRDEERLLLESVLSKVIYQIDYHTAVEKGYIVPMEAYYIEMPKIEKDYGNYNAAYKALVVEREDRNELIAQMVSRLIEQGASTLVLTKQIEHGERLQLILSGMGINVPFAEGKNEENEQLVSDFNARKIDGMIGTIGVMGEGMDTRPAEWIFLAGGGKSKNQFMQNVGRGFRKYPGKQSCKIILFKDPSNKWLMEHFKKCVKYLEEEYSLTPFKLEL